MTVLQLILASLVGPAIELGKSIIAPIKRQFGYICCFNSYIESLRDEAKNLDETKTGLQMQVDAARRNAQVIFPQVETWLTRADQIQDSIRRIEADIPKLQCNYLNMKSRFSLSKKAKKTTESMKGLRDGCDFHPICQPAPPAAMAFIPFEQTYDFDSRKQIEEDIMAALRGKKVNMVGICGMGGVGKTTMAKRIMNKVREENLFDEAVIVVVGQQVDMLKIQREIAELLGLKFEDETLQARAHKLRARLMGPKRVLIGLDDVWEKVKLEDLGIPCEGGFKGCTILLTSRDREVLNKMDAKDVFAMEILPEEEAWFLFRQNTGSCVDDSRLLSVAKDVAEECKGLPIALITVARALQGQTRDLVWKDARTQLRRCNPRDIPDVIEKVYNPLKLSYDIFNNQNAGSLFLLCSLFPEDFNIRLEHLAWYVMGLRIIEEIRDLEDAKNRVCALAERLKNRFLLLEGHDEHHVKMHDVVRDVAIFIASQKGCVNLSSMGWSREHCNCTWISLILKEESELPGGWIFPRLALLLIDNSERIEFQMDDHFFEGMTELNVLFLKSVQLISLPQTITRLVNLRTLHLDSCTMRSISAVGNLLNLEILSCRSCHEIVELPVGLRKLRRLRLLEFSYCTSLTTIKPGIISGLVRLQELKMRGSFKGWEAKKNGEKGRNISLKELESLRNLTLLEIEIGDSSLAEEDVHFHSEMAKYDIRIYGKWPSDISNHGKKMFLHFWREVTIGNWIRKLLRNTEFLDLTGEGSNSLDLAQVQMVKSFGLSDCSTVKKLVNTTSTVFPVLESLWLCRLHRLEEICEIPAGSNSFGNLKELTLDCLPALKHLWKTPNQNVLLRNLGSIYIWHCNNLRNLFSLAMARALLHLELLEIKGCEMMEEIFCNENGKAGENHVRFPVLKRLSLGHLPRLTTFCKRIEGIEFPGLTYMEINKCPKLISFASAGSDLNSDGGHDNDSLHLFCSQKVIFGSLKELYIKSYENISSAWCNRIPVGLFSKLEKLVIDNCGNIRSLFSCSTAQNLVSLKELAIQSCLEMGKVIGDEENVCEESPFPSLELVELRGLQNLRSFCEWRCGLELPSLKQALIDICPRMESFNAKGSLRTLNLESIKIDDKAIDMEDLNAALQQYFRENEYQRKSRAN